MTQEGADFHLRARGVRGGGFSTGHTATCGRKKAKEDKGWTHAIVVRGKWTISSPKKPTKETPSTNGRGHGKHVAVLRDDWFGQASRRTAKRWKEGDELGHPRRVTQRVTPPVLTRSAQRATTPGRCTLRFRALTSTRPMF